MLLRNLNIIGQDSLRHLHIKNERINEITSDEKSIGIESNELQIDCANAIAFPGLINSHDHLDFNLFPQLGSKVYKNYIEWGADIQEKNKTIIGNIKKIPQQLRAQWGIYKNLINGVTTVVNHGE